MKSRHWGENRLSLSHRRTRRTRLAVSTVWLFATLKQSNMGLIVTADPIRKAFSSVEIEQEDGGEAIRTDRTDLNEGVLEQVRDRVVRLSTWTPYTIGKPCRPKKFALGLDAQGKLDHPADVELPRRVDVDCADRSTTGPLAFMPPARLFGLTMAPGPTCCCQSL